MRKPTPRRADERTCCTTLRLCAPATQHSCNRSSRLLRCESLLSRRCRPLERGYLRRRSADEPPPPRNEDAAINLIDWPAHYVLRAGAAAAAAARQQPVGGCSLRNSLRRALRPEKRLETRRAMLICARRQLDALGRCSSPLKSASTSELEAAQTATCCALARNPCEASGQFSGGGGDGDGDSLGDTGHCWRRQRSDRVLSLSLLPDSAPSGRCRRRRRLAETQTKERERELVGRV